MLKKTRVSGTMDFARLADAVSRPGIDPRTWVSLAIIRKVNATSEGVFADVLLMPSGISETARVGAEYAGVNFGAYYPLQKDDEVVVEAPSGDPDEGLVISKRLYSRSDPPPARAVSDPEDAVIHIRKDQNIRIIVEGGGKCVLQADAGKVYVGDEDGTQPVALGTAIKNHFDDLKSSFDSHVHSGGTIIGFTGTPVVPAPSTPDVEADKAEVR